MRVKIRRKEDLDRSFDWSKAKLGEHGTLWTLLNSDLTYKVHCVLFFDDEVIYLIGHEHGFQAEYLCSADAFHLADDTVDSEWILKSRVKNTNMMYLGRRFEDYCYLGFPEFIQMPNFLEKLYDDDAEAVGILQLSVQRG